MNFHGFTFLGFLSIVLAGLFLADVVTTALILEMGGSELNPLMIDIVGHPWLHSVVKFIAALFVVAVACYADHIKKNAGAVILIIACSIFLVVVAHNICVLIGFTPPDVFPGF